MSNARGQVYSLPPPSILRAYQGARLAATIAETEKTQRAWIEAKTMNDRYRRLHEHWENTRAQSR